jgi:hypothetical protein
MVMLFMASHQLIYGLNWDPIISISRLPWPLFISKNNASTCIFPIYDEFTSISSPLGVNLYKYVWLWEKKSDFKWRWKKIHRDVKFSLKRKKRVCKFHFRRNDIESALSWLILEKRIPSDISVRYTGEIHKVLWIKKFKLI